MLLQDRFASSSKIREECAGELSKSGNQGERSHHSYLYENSSVSQVSSGEKNSWDAFWDGLSQKWEQLTQIHRKDTNSGEGAKGPSTNNLTEFAPSGEE